MLGACAGPFPHAFNGVANQLLEVNVSAAIGAADRQSRQELSGGGGLHDADDSDRSPGRAAIRLRPAPPVGVPTLGANNTFSGVQTAPAFVGGGSGLTNVNANLLDSLDSTAFAAAVHGHDVPRSPTR